MRHQGGGGTHGLFSSAHFERLSCVMRPIVRFFGAATPAKPACMQSEVGVAVLTSVITLARGLSPAETFDRLFHLNSTNIYCT
jgi:hypothetical protein